MARTHGQGLMTDLARDYLLLHPGMLKRTAALALCGQYPEIFRSTEQARTVIRNITGTNGGEHLRNLDPNLLIEEPPVSDEWPVGIVEAPWTPYQIPGDSTYLVLVDLHIPFHRINAILVAIDYARRKYGKKLNGVLLPGDVLDIYSGSQFLKDPRVVKFNDELRMGEQFFRALRKHLKPERVVWMWSNHERRFENYLIANRDLIARSKRCRDALRLDALLGLDEIGGITVVRDQIMYHRNLAVLHGDENKSFGNTVNAARTAFLKHKANVIVGHSHQSSGHVGTDFWGTQLSSRSVGCMCDLHPRWKRCAHEDWNHGFGILNTRGSWTFENYRILKESEVVPA